MFCVRTASFHVIPASCQHQLRTLVICKIQNSLSKNSWFSFSTLGQRLQVHFAGIKEYEFGNNLFPSTWLLRLNIRKRFFFSHVWSKWSCKGYTMFIKFHFWMLFMYCGYFLYTSSYEETRCILLYKYHLLTNWNTSSHA